MRKILCTVALVALAGCQTTQGQCTIALDKARQARALAKVAQASLDAACAAGVATKACAREQKYVLIVRAALDAADAGASAYCAGRPTTPPPLPST